MALLKTMSQPKEIKMESDKELLELAAKAAGAEGVYHEQDSSFGIGFKKDIVPSLWWNPLADDGDALRLMIRLEIKLIYFTGGVSANRSIHGFIADERSGDIMADARRAITRVAAEIGRRMQDEQSTSATG